jgi:transcriptional regulator with XRE-family HTH domain
MVLEKIFELFPDKEPTPNKFTLEMGELIRSARNEANLSQSDLAKKVYRRQATISDLETGKSQADAITVALIAAALKKPVAFFFPPWVHSNINEEDLPPEELELLIQFRRIWNDDKIRIAINQITSLADLDEKELLEKREKEFINNLDKDSPMYKRLVKKGFIQEDTK